MIINYKILYMLVLMVMDNGSMDEIIYIYISKMIIFHSHVTGSMVSTVLSSPGRAILPSLRLTAKPATDVALRFAPGRRGNGPGAASPKKISQSIFPTAVVCLVHTRYQFHIMSSECSWLISVSFIGEGWGRYPAMERLLGTSPCSPQANGSSCPWHRCHR